MKKLFSLFITVAMLLSMTACAGGNTISQADTAPDFVGENATEGEVYYFEESKVDEILAGVESVVLETSDDYEEIIKNLGFDEVGLEIHRVLKADGTFGNPTATPKRLAYKDGYFRLELSHYEQETDKETDGWVLYGTKAAEIADISGLDPTACDFYDVFDFAEAFEEYKGFSAQYVDYCYYNGEAQIVVKATFFPETGNLYNLVKAFDSFPEDGTAAPNVIWRREQLED